MGKLGIRGGGREMIRQADPYRDTDVIDARAPRTNQAIVGTLSLLAVATGWWPILGVLAGQPDRFSRPRRARRVERRPRDRRRVHPPALHRLPLARGRAPRVGPHRRYGGRLATPRAGAKVRGRPRAHRRRGDLFRRRRGAPRLTDEPNESGLRRMETRVEARIRELR